MVQPFFTKINLSQHIGFHFESSVLRGKKQSMHLWFRQEVVPCSCSISLIPSWPVRSGNSLHLLSIRLWYFVTLLRYYRTFLSYLSKQVTPISSSKQDHSPCALQVHTPCGKQERPNTLRKAKTTHLAKASYPHNTLQRARFLTLITARKTSALVQIKKDLRDRNTSHRALSEYSILSSTRSKYTFHLGERNTCTRTSP